MMDVTEEETKALLARHYEDFQATAELKIPAGLGHPASVVYTSEDRVFIGDLSVDSTRKYPSPFLRLLYLSVSYPNEYAFSTYKINVFRIPGSVDSTLEASNLGNHTLVKFMLHLVALKTLSARIFVQHQGDNEKKEVFLSHFKNFVRTREIFLFMDVPSNSEVAGSTLPKTVDLLVLKEPQQPLMVRTTLSNFDEQIIQKLRRAVLESIVRLGSAELPSSWSAPYPGSFIIKHDVNEMEINDQTKLFGVFRARKARPGGVPAVYGSSLRDRWIAMEDIPYSVESNLNMLTLNDFKTMISTVIDVLDAMKEHLGKLHADLAARNILFDKNRIFYLADYGKLRSERKSLSFFRKPVGVVDVEIDPFNQLFKNLASHIERWQRHPWSLKIIRDDSGNQVDMSLDNTIANLSERELKRIYTAILQERARNVQ